MTHHNAEIIWTRGEQTFLDNKYSRRHTLRFDGGLDVPGSSSPHVVTLPYSDPSAVDPEEAFVASLSSCHMLWFLGIASKYGFVVDTYKDVAVGTMCRNAEGKMAISEVLLRPEVEFSGERLPRSEEVDRMHDEAHHACFIANSVRTVVRCKPVHAVPSL